YRVEQGDFVYNRLFAWKGSFAVATSENHGCYVSNEFPCFRAKADRICVHFLWRYFSREPAWTEALGLSTGGTPTSRNRLKEEAFLQLTIPLPPLAEQRRLVERIDAVAAKIEEAKTLRGQGHQAIRSMLLSAYQSITNGVELRSMKEVAPLVRRPVQPQVGELYYELGIRSFGRG